MARHRQPPATISLFSFQDIVTSVMGIMLFVTLMLAVDLVSRHEAVSSDDTSPDAERNESALQDTISELAKRKTELEAAVTHATAEVGATAGRSSAELREALERTRAEMAALRAEADKLSAEHGRLVRKQRSLGDDPARKNTEEKLRTVQAEIDRTQAELDSLKAEKRVLFSVARGEERDGWLAEITLDRIAVAPLGHTQTQVAFAQEDLPRRQAAFLEWVQQQNKSRRYVLLVIHPGCDKVFFEIRQRLEGSGVSYGFDLVGAKQHVLEP